MQDRSTCLIALLAAAFAFSPTTFAQTGKPLETEKAPATSPTKSLTGVWLEQTGQGPALLTSSKQEPPMTAWGKEQFKANVAGSDPHVRCNAAGIPRVDLSARPIEFIQTEKRVLMLYEESHDWRQIWTDGRALATDADPTFNGISVGKWDGDTLVADTADFNDKTWLDNAGHPHSDALHVTERIRRVNHDTLQIAFTIEDPQAYTGPWTTSPRIFKLKPGYHLAEDFCAPDDVLGIPGAAKRPRP
jgi:hypothetical protein